MPKPKLGANAPMPNYGNQPQDATRVAQNQSYPPDQSVYSNPITSNQVSSMNSPGQISSPNSLPTIPSPTTPPIYQ